MSKFSEHLEQCIMTSGMTENQLAKMSGFTRSYIALMKNGQRVSPDTKKIKKLLDALNLSPHENDEIWSEYIRARMGDGVYERNQAIIDLLESFTSFSKVSIKTVHEHEIPDVRTVMNRMELEYVAKAVMERAAQKKNGYIHIIMQPEIGIVQNIIPWICKGHKDLRVEHIVCFDNQTGNGCEPDHLYNIQMLKCLMPVIIFSDSANYHILHYYDRIKSHFSTSSILPYLIITDEYVISINAQQDKAVIFREKEIIQMYEQLFQEQKHCCRSMITRLLNDMEMYEYYLSRDVSEEAVYTIAQQPCLGVLKVDDLIRKYYNQSLEKSKKLLTEVMNRNSRELYTYDKKSISFCTLDGLRRLAEEGIIDELPREVYSMLDKEDRVNILQQILDLIKIGKYELYLVDAYEINLTREIQVYSYGMMELSILYLGEDKKSRFVLNEYSITRMIYEFCRDFAKNPQVCSVNKSVGYIENLIENLVLEINDQ